MLSTILLFFISISIFIRKQKKLKLGKFLSQPCIKFITHSSAYFVFIILITVSSLQFASDVKFAAKFSDSYPTLVENFTKYVNNDNLLYRFMQKDFYMRSTFPGNLDFVITLWIISLFWHELKEFCQNGYADYFLNTSNLVDLCMLVLYICSYAIKYYSMSMVLVSKNSLNSNAFWQTVATLNSSDYDAQKMVFETFYWLNDGK